MSLKLASSTLDEWMALGGRTVVNQENGRSGRATAVTIGGPEGSAVFAWLSEMFTSKLAQSVPNGSFDNMLALGNQSAPMTLDSSDFLSSINEILQRGHYIGVNLAVAPTPRALPAASGAGAICGGGGLHLVGRSSKEQIDGAWQFAKFLVEPGSQAQWAVATGSIPIRKAAAASAEVTHSWDATPGYRVRVRATPVQSWNDYGIGPSHRGGRRRSQTHSEEP